MTHKLTGIRFVFTDESFGEESNSEGRFANSVSSNHCDPEWFARGPLLAPHPPPHGALTVIVLHLTVTIGGGGTLTAAVVTGFFDIVFNILQNPDWYA